MYRDADIRTAMNDRIREGKKTACHVAFRMKHTGDAPGLPAKGKEDSFEAVIEAHNPFEQLGSLRKLDQEPRSVTVE